MISKIELTTEQKQHIGLAIDQLESNSNRSNAEEIALNVLKAILPERLPTQTQLLANQFQEKLKESIQLDLTHREKHKTGKLEREAKRGEGRHRAFWAEDGGALDIISKMNKHVNRCYQDFSIRRTDDGQHAEYGMGLIFPDLVARAYYQLASVIKSNEKKQLEFRTCELCAHVYKAHNENQRFCSTNDKNCKRQAATQRAYQKQMQDPEKEAKKRKQSQDSQRKMRQKKRD